MNFICQPKVYEYKGQIFEHHSYFGYWPLRKKDHEPFKRVGRKFYSLFNEFDKLPNKEKRKYQIGGGVICF